MDIFKKAIALGDAHGILDKAATTDAERLELISGMVSGFALVYGLSIVAIMDEAQRMVDIAGGDPDVQAAVKEVRDAD